MPRTKRTPRLETRLTPETFVKFEQLCLAEKSTKTQLVREAILFYLDHRMKTELRKQEEETASRLDKIADRICGLLYKVGVDSNAVAQFIYEMGDDEERDAFDECHGKAVKYMRNRITADEKEAARNFDPNSA